MKKLIFTIIFSLCMLPLMALKDSMACSQSSPLYTHFCFMFVHASWLHWACNTWSLLVLHNLFKPQRLIVAYILSVAVSFIPVSLPVLGISVIVCFFIGFMAKYLYYKSALSLFLTMAILIVSCFLPGFAGVYHIIMFVLGALYFQIECFLNRLGNYING